MKKFIFLLISLLSVCFIVEADAQKRRAKIPPKAVAPKNYQPIEPESSPALQTLLNRAVGETINNFAPKKIEFDYVAATLIDLRNAQNIKIANVRGDERIYPASVVKLFYMAALHQWIEDGKLKLTPEIERGLRDMIVESSNDATHFMVDILTGTSGGGELLPKDLAIYAEKRNAVNRYFESLGFERITVNQKTYCEDLYGRERQFWNDGKNRNMLTTNATARLLAEIALGRFVSAERSRRMMTLLKREPFTEKKNKDEDDQAHDFTAIALIERKLTTAQIWSKAGWTSKTRHDAAYIETPDGLKFVLVVFTENMANERNIIPMIAGKILDNLGAVK